MKSSSGTATRLRLSRAVCVGFLLTLLAAAAVPPTAFANDFGGTSGAGGPGNGGGPGAGSCGPGGGGGSPGPGGADGGGSPPGTPGNANGAGPPASAGGPVAFFSGAETIDADDLVVRGVFPIRVHRQYDNQTDYDSPLGHGWSFEFDRRLYQYPDNSIVIRYGCGIRDRYTYSGGSYAAPAGAGRLANLVQQPDGTFQLTYLNGIRDYYDAQGRLTAFQDAQGNRQEMTYDSRGKLPLMGTSKHALDPTAPLTVAYNYRLTRIDERGADGVLTGHLITLAYDDASGRLTTVTTNDGRSVTYGHDVQPGGTTRGNLTRVNGLAAIVSDYQYNDPNDLHNVTQDTPVLGKAGYVNTYDNQDRVTRQTYGTRQLDFEYTTPLTKTKVTTTVTDANGANPYTQVEYYEFDPSAKITKRTDALGNEFRYTVNTAKVYSRSELWQMSSGTLSLLQAKDWTYDSAGNRASEIVTLSSGEVITHSWTYNHNWIATDQIVSSLAPSKIFRTEYAFNFDASGVPLNVQAVNRRNDDGTFQTTSYTYDGRNRLITTTLPDGVQIVDEYTGEFLTKISFKSGGVALPQNARQFDYDSRGFRTKVWDADNNLTKIDYDDFGRVIAVTNPLGEQTLKTYTGQLLTQVEVGRTTADGEGQVTQYLYDSQNRRTGVQRKGDSGTFVNYTTYQLDSEGRVLTVTDAIGRTTSRSYDLAGRLKQVTDPAGKITRSAYDAAGNRISVIDPLNHETRYEYDALNRKTAVIQLGITPNARTQFTYDAAGNLTSFTDGEGHTTAYTYDSLSRRTQTTQPLGQSVQQVYDGRNRPVQVTNSRGQKIIYTYEDWGPAKLEQQYPTASATTPTRTVTYTRDNRGNVLNLTDDGIQSGQYYASTYDALDRRYDETLSYIPGGNRVLQHRYDRFGNRKQIGLQDAAPVTNTYNFNKLNQVATASLAGAALTNTYYADDDRQTVAYPNGVTETYTYKANGPLDTVSSAGPSGPLSAFSYTYDDALNVATLTDGDGVHSFLYDGANRMTQATHPSSSGLGTESFVYDRVGNRKDSANSSLWTYDANNRIAQGGAVTYTFDADGSLATRNDGTTFSHDVKSRLTQYAGGSTTASYLYDSFGRRIRKTVNGTTTWYLWDLTSVLAEYDASGSRTLRYGYLPGALVAAQVQDANGTYYVHSGAKQTPRLLTNSAGQVAWQARYAAYGTAAVNGDVDGNGVGIVFNQRLPGQYADAESALSYNYARYYDSSLGRYAESDPIGLNGGFDLYLYANGNPTTYVDPSGLGPHGGGRTATPTFPTPGAIANPYSPENASWVHNAYDQIGDAIDKFIKFCRKAVSADDDEKNDCLKEIEGCMKTCQRARRDFNQIREVWGGSWAKCLAGCVPFKCQDYIDDEKHADPEAE
jgi:RHS repeat-associated protein